MTNFKEQRICIKFCFNLKKTVAETHRMLQEAFGDNAMSQSKTFLWYKRFKDGRTSVDDDKRSGRPSISTTPENIAKVREAILADRRQPIHDVCEIVGLSYGTVQHILVDNLNMIRIFVRFVPRLLSNDQKALRVSVCRERKQQAIDDPNFISNIITGDKIWVYGYDPETKQQSLQWKSPNSLWPKSASSSQQCQIHVDRFFDIQGIVQKQFIPPGQTVNGKFYCEVLKQLKEGNRRKRPRKWKKHNWFLHHDDAPAHTSLVVRQFLTSKSITLIPPPIHLTLPPATFLYSPR